MTNAIDGSLTRVMALHALAYCERLFYLEEVEEIRLADASVYAGRTLHEQLKRAEEDVGEWTSLELASEALGLIGKVDALRRRDGSLVPYEHKRGRPRRDGKAAAAWPSDALQISAYGMLLEEATGRPVAEGRIRYHAENVTVRVPLDEPAREGVRSAVARAEELRRSPYRPPVTDNDRLCIRCSLAPVCLPEEERLLVDPDREPLRLFPPDRERRTVHVVDPSVRISRAGNTLKVTGDGGARKLLAGETAALVLHGHPQVTTQALHFCAGHDISVHWISAGGRYVAGLAPGAGPVQRRLRQYQALSDPGFCLRLARKLATAKIETSVRYLLRATRGMDREAIRIAGPLGSLRSCIKAVARAEGLDELRGHEGLAGRAYFAVLPRLLRDDAPEQLRPDGRSRRPPRDRFNALLSFGYSLLYQAVLQAVLTVGLEPAFGFFHAPRSSAHPLVLDLMELFRVPVWDIAVVASINRLQWEPTADFEVAGGRVWLSPVGRRRAIELFERRLQDQWRHPVIGHSLTYSRLIDLEVRLLEKEWSGQPGLFAKMRLR